MEQPIDSYLLLITQILSSGGLIGFFIHTIRGLRKNVESLKGVIETQNQHIESFAKEMEFIREINSINKGLIDDSKKLIEYNRSMQLSLLPDDLNVGDLVRIIGGSDIITDQGSIDWRKEMAQFVGTNCSIIEVNEITPISYRLSIDHGTNEWSPKWFIKLK